VDATVAELIYAGPLTRIAAVTASGATLSATVLSAGATLPRGLDHGAPITLAWPQTAVHDLNN